MEYRVPKAITESTELPKPENKSEELIIDFSDHQYITSSGIALWIKWLFGGPSEKISLKSVSSQFLSQAASISSILSEFCEIQSFKLPLYSESLDAEAEVLVTMDQVELGEGDKLKFKIDFANEDADDWEPDVLGSNFFNPIIKQLKGV